MINHKAIALLIGEKWNGPNPRGDFQDYVNDVYKEESEWGNPDFTLPDYYDKLKLWLFTPENRNFWTAFEKWLWEKYSPWPPIHIYITEIMPNLPSLFTEFMGTEECQDRFGWEERFCNHCRKGRVQMHFTHPCESCGGTGGRIKRPWLKAYEEEPCQD